MVVAAGCIDAAMVGPAAKLRSSKAEEISLREDLFVVAGAAAAAVAMVDEEVDWESRINST